MTFSEKPSIVKVKGDTVCQKIANIRSAPWGYNTDLEKAFDMVLKIAVQNHVSPEEMVKSLVIVSDMEIDAACGSSWSFYDKMKDKFRASGYEIPNVVFWNVNSRHDIFHADSDRPGVQLCSGQTGAFLSTLAPPLPYLMQACIIAGYLSCIKYDITVSLRRKCKNNRYE